MPCKKYIYEIPDDANHTANKVIKWVDSGTDVLEVGCASGIQSRILKKSLIVVNIKEIDLSQALGDRCFDTIPFVDVLEHLVDPSAASKKCYQESEL
jgi:2-polyprenyl-3-methyl-5-hydroxy-6-metoxy-1,4-benzoquinol methylase